MASTVGAPVRVRADLVPVSKFDVAPKYAGRAGKVTGVLETGTIGTMLEVEFRDGSLVAFHPEELDPMDDPCDTCGCTVLDYPDERGCADTCHLTPAENAALHKLAKEALR